MCLFSKGKRNSTNDCSGYLIGTFCYQCQPREIKVMSFSSIYQFLMYIGSFALPIYIWACILWIPSVIAAFCFLMHLRRKKNEKIMSYCIVMLTPLIIDVILCSVPGVYKIEEFIFVIITFIYLCSPLTLLFLQLQKKEKIDVKLILFFLISWFFFYSTHSTVHFWASV